MVKFALSKITFCPRQKTKLEIFNLPEVKNSKNREMKMKVRKAKTVPEIFAAYYDIQHSNS